MFNFEGHKVNFISSRLGLRKRKTRR